MKELAVVIEVCDSKTLSMSNVDILSILHTFYTPEIRSAFEKRAILSSRRVMSKNYDQVLRNEASTLNNNNKIKKIIKII